MREGAHLHGLEVCICYGCIRFGSGGDGVTEILVLNGPCAGKQVAPAHYERVALVFDPQGGPRSPRRVIRFTLSVDPNHKTTVVEYHLVVRERVRPRRTPLDEWKPYPLDDRKPYLLPDRMAEILTAPLTRHCRYYYALPDTIHSDTDVAEALDQLVRRQTDDCYVVLDDHLVPMQDMLLSDDKDTQAQAVEMLRAMPEHAPDVALALVNEVRKAQREALDARTDARSESAWAWWELSKIVARAEDIPSNEVWHRYRDYSLADVVGRLKQLIGMGT